MVGSDKATYYYNPCEKFTEKDCKDVAVCSDYIVVQHYVNICMYIIISFFTLITVQGGENGLC